MVVSRPCPNPSPPSTPARAPPLRRVAKQTRSTNCMSRPDDLLPGIRRKILDGTLPKQNCHVTWYGHGTGQICVACERPIAADDVEVECDLPGGGTIRLHRRCYEFWAAERP